jgi:biopolymer transport protein ExbB/biopolymer transport protein TolQ
MDFSLGAVWESMGALARIVALILLVMGGASLAVFLERLRYFARVHTRGLEFALRATSLLEQRQHKALLELAGAHPDVPLAELVRAGVGTYLKGEDERRSGQGALSPVELARRALERRVDTLKAEARRGFNLLASVGSVCPFVGLFGTVVGIINAFKGISTEKSTGLGAVAGGISEALVTTAIGLFVAIPAVMMFNFFTNKLEAFNVEMGNSSSELIDYFIKRSQKTSK